jgi:lysophospholipase L1-like esterase
VAIVIGWRVLIHVRSSAPWLPRAGVLIRFLCLTAALFEISATRSWEPVHAVNSLCVIGDSITAGLNDGEFTWPQRLAHGISIDVRDASQPGATLRSASQQAESLADDRTSLLLEIGGNDLLAGRTVGEFQADCEALCSRVADPGRTIWMCELPLPPLCSRYGADQRRICRRHGIRLIAKREMMAILTTSGATVDGIHLSPLGQERFCRLVMEALGVSARPTDSPGQYRKIERTFVRQ